jgi:hypothetical protein
MSTRVTAFDVRGHIEPLQAAGYALPKGTTREQLAKIWAEVFEGVSIDELARAVRTFLRDGSRYWPKASEIRQIALALRQRTGHVIEDCGSLSSRYVSWEQRSHDGSPCPVCGAVMQELTPARRRAPPGGPSRFGVFHDDAEHRRQGVPHVGYPHSSPDVR